jgi:antiviral helicase SKI2
MLYKGADLIRDVEFVIFDEVHYVNDSEVSSDILVKWTKLISIARCRVGGSHHHVTRTCQYHLALCHGAEHQGICRLGWVCQLHMTLCNVLTRPVERRRRIFTLFLPLCDLFLLNISCGLAGIYTRSSIRSRNSLEMGKLSISDLREKLNAT